MLDVAEFSHQLLHLKAHENKFDVDLQFDYEWNECHKKIDPHKHFGEGEICGDFARRWGLKEANNGYERYVDISFSIELCHLFLYFILRRISSVHKDQHSLEAPQLVHEGEVV